MNVRPIFFWVVMLAQEDRFLVDSRRFHHSAFSPRRSHHGVLTTRRSHHPAVSPLGCLTTRQPHHPADSPLFQKQGYLPNLLVEHAIA